MKTEQKLEIYRELFGSLPEAPAGKELVGIECRPAGHGEVYLDLDYNPIAWKDAKGSPHYSCPVAIFQDTHREDGTPIYIDPLPEPPEGYRVEYFGQRLLQEYMGEATGYCIYVCDKWHTHLTEEDKKPGGSVQHYARLYKVKPPTTLEDLVGDDGQKNFYLISDIDTNVTWPTQSIAGYEEFGSVNVMIECVRPPRDKDIALRFVPISYADTLGYRWSHSPFTTWEKANEFIPE